METWFLYFITKSISYALFMVLIVTFLESLALVGLFLPGIVLMSILGTLIGNGTLSFYPAWIVGIIGCMCGDWISYYCGFKFKKCITNLHLLKNNNVVLDKITNTLTNYPITTILLGRFIGPTRPLVPMVCGMLNISLKTFIIPNILGCILWPPIYFLPGIFTGIAISNTTNYSENTYFKIQFLAAILLIWLGIFLLWKLWKRYTDTGKKKIYISNVNLCLLLTISLSAGITIMIYIQSNSTLIFFRKILWKILISSQ
ncbi:putative DedA-family membrane protein [Buchnera aphidicola str. Bp (Baizongia pistaciae)]|uniref:Uncharacterized membrane protein bbp_130 n=1 Tax=Buchnera aphidicola subsp. Baizongia pistaciae (strain Bp) TaxID=224915 RepID=Y130_BUCBP|nr:DedA family protein [Buchnera aphidicola]Q89AV4.1 RecName: Full=Uncharacterized membrane protein bbp_130 [Buchnera aphidicola str. Bp (Baizongia pistaciae)]AAO26864.1 putative DedA-family membrane protein [Buchnera aphidicola str. Bp (Baizongia pistaciae)]